MLTEERRTFILKKLTETGSVTVHELVEELGASESTIRRDITVLDREGKLVKVFGGAVAQEESSSMELSVLMKESINKDEKQRIAEYAANLIKPGDYVYIDSGTTTGYMMSYLHEKNATYVTNAVSHAKDMVRKGLKVLLIGGELKENTEAIVGADAILNIQKYHFTKGFFGANGISMSQGIMTPDVREALIKRVAFENTQPGGRYVLADHDKFGVLSTVTFADSGGAVIITDKSPDDIYRSKYNIKAV